MIEYQKSPIASNGSLAETFVTSRKKGSNNRRWSDWISFVKRSCKSHSSLHQRSYRMWCKHFHRHYKRFQLFPMSLMFSRNNRFVSEYPGGKHHLRLQWSEDPVEYNEKSYDVFYGIETIPLFMFDIGGVTRILPMGVLNTKVFEKYNKGRTISMSPIEVNGYHFDGRFRIIVSIYFLTWKR